MNCPEVLRKSLDYNGSMQDPKADRQEGTRNRFAISSKMIHEENR